ncbi:uncharacterized protein METZ01_LOCUS111495 [marine metagenome]|uniref:Uncharacterized protein n=1 Tax=marine metagenome TaxID=408172 RepID=A0A381X2C4_9ZZZZ
MSADNRGISEDWWGTTAWGNHIYEILRFALWMTFNTWMEANTMRQGYMG